MPLPPPPAFPAASAPLPPSADPPPPPPCHAQSNARGNENPGHGCEINRQGVQYNATYRVGQAVETVAGHSLGLVARVALPTAAFPTEGLVGFLLAHAPASPAASKKAVVPDAGPEKSAEVLARAAHAAAAEAAGVAHRTVGAVEPRRARPAAPAATAVAVVAVAGAARVGERREHPRVGLRGGPRLRRPGTGPGAAARSARAAVVAAGRCRVRRSVALAAAPAADRGVAERLRGRPRLPDFRRPLRASRRAVADHDVVRARLDGERLGEQDAAGAAAALARVLVRRAPAAGAAAAHEEHGGGDAHVHFEDAVRREHVHDGPIMRAFNSARRHNGLGLLAVGERHVGEAVQLPRVAPLGHEARHLERRRRRVAPVRTVAQEAGSHVVPGLGPPGRRENVALLGRGREHGRGLAVRSGGRARAEVADEEGRRG